MGYIWDYKPLTKWGCTSKIIQVDQNWRPKERHIFQFVWRWPKMTQSQIMFNGIMINGPPWTNQPKWIYTACDYAIYLFQWDQ